MREVFSRTSGQQLVGQEGTTSRFAAMSAAFQAITMGNGKRIEKKKWMVSIVKVKQNLLVETTSPYN